MNNEALSGRPSGAGQAVWSRAGTAATEARPPPRPARDILFDAFGGNASPADPDAATLADTLLGSMADGHLQLIPSERDRQMGLPQAQLARRLASLPPQAWQALADHAAASGAPIRQVSLPGADDPAHWEAVVAGLNQITTLDQLRVAPGRGSDLLPLHGLTHAPAQLAVELLCDRAGAWQVQLPPGMQCTLHQPFAFLNPGPAVVHYLNAAGELTQPPHKLDDFAYFHDDMKAGPAHDRKAEAGQPEHSKDIRLNAQARFTPADAARAHLADSLIVCRHLVMGYLENDVRGSARFDGLRTRQAIEASITAEAELSFRDTFSQTPARTFLADGLAQAVCDELHTMRPGDTRSFVMTTSLHAMALTLRAKARPDGTTAYVVRLYDPNRTATHLRLVVSDPDRIKQPRWRSLGDWVGPDVSAYFKEQPAWISLRTWNRTGSPPKAAAATTTTTTTTAGAAAPLPIAGQRDAKGFTPLALALQQGKAQEVTAMVLSLGLTPSPFTQEERYLLLRADAWRGGSALPALSAPVAAQHPEAAQAYMAAVLSLPVECLSLAQRMALLEARVTHKGAPVLHVLSARAPIAPASELAPEHEAIYRMAQVIAGSTSLLPQQKTALLRADAPGLLGMKKSAVEAALGHKNGGAVAALVAGILKSSATRQTKDELIAALKTTPQKILKQLQRTEGEGSTAVARALLQQALEAHERKSG